MIRERGFSWQITYSKRLGWGLMGRRRGCSPVAEQLPRMLEALGLIPTTKEKKKKNNTTNKTNNYTKKGKEIKILNVGWVWWHKPLVLTLGRQRNKCL